MKPGGAGANAAIRAMKEHEAALAELESVPRGPSRRHGLPRKSALYGLIEFDRD
ncbi:hypothetical protein GCM10009530_17090 [Microbispora corallina]|uniref:Uncharacterized protein n=1 Tax=Microbispora corallina TaxID=83302 RepID=A0ABQ4FXY9_9ACTN|nr:hypothetical protein Mco01_26680 [Microbispora corallina]